MAVPQKLKIKLPDYIAILLPGIYPKELKIKFGRAICTPMFIAAYLQLLKCGSNPSIHRQMIR